MGADAPLTDFDELSVRIERGREVIATGADGRHVRGRAACTLADGLVIWRLGGFPWTARVWRFERATLARVQVVDSVREGWLWGASAGIGTTLTFVAACSGERDPECRGWATLAGISFGALEALLGQLIDASQNQTVFSQLSERRVALRVWPRRDGAVFQLTMAF